MIKKLLARIPHRVVINCDHKPYLTRWYLFRRARIAFFLHRFYRSDEDRALHDHPWSFLTFILWRGYIEHTETPCDCCLGGALFRIFVCPSCEGKLVITKGKRKWPGMIMFRPAEWRHRVELVNGKACITLVVRFKRRRDWGFWTNNGFVQWNKWWQQNCE